MERVFQILLRSPSVKCGRKARVPGRQKRVSGGREVRATFDRITRPAAKAPEDWRSPRPGGFLTVPVIREAFWTAVVLYRCSPCSLSMGGLSTIDPMSDVTQLLNAIDAGDPKAADQLLPLVYEELRKLAVVRMANEKLGQTLQPTALVHEAWLKIAGEGNEHFANRRHFFKAAAMAMQQILIDNARRKSRWKRGGRLERVELEGLELAAD